MDRLQFERRLWENGVTYVAGVDEAGRGCLFGDVVAAAVVLPRGLVIPDVDDSKKLSAAKREELYAVVVEKAVAVGVGRVDAGTIDRINIRQAVRLAMKRAIEQLGLCPEHVLIDAETIDVALPQTPIVRGDSLSQSIAAASIVAKVTRDRLCAEWDAAFPQYGIARHKGYGTKEHREAVLRFGPTPLHRMTFLSKWGVGDVVQMSLPILETGG